MKTLPIGTDNIHDTQDSQAKAEAIPLTLCIPSLEKSFPREQCICVIFYQSRQPQGPSVWYQINKKKIVHKKSRSLFLAPLIIDLETFKLFVYRNFFG